MRNNDFLTSKPYFRYVRSSGKISKRRFSDREKYVIKIDSVIQKFKSGFSNFKEIKRVLNYTQFSLHLFSN